MSPAFRTVTTGLLTSAVVLDWLGGPESRPAARRLIALGLLGTAASRRVAANEAVGASLFAASLLVRSRGGEGRALALAGAAALAVEVDDGPPEEWTSVLADRDLAEGHMRCVSADGTDVMVARTGGELYALSNHCSHLGAPLHEGEIRDGTVVCPAHESVFALRDGALIYGPAAYPQPSWDARVRAGRIEVRRR
jgi:nitrite reductase/ring-hydroxylating ferredoxin subunit